jgi:hypothetical protein
MQKCNSLYRNTIHWKSVSTFKEVLTPFKEALDKFTMKYWKDRQIWYVKSYPPKILDATTCSGQFEHNFRRNETN